MPTPADPSDVQMLEILGTSENTYFGLIDLRTLDEPKSINICDNDIASLYGHSVGPIRSFGESEVRDQVAYVSPTPLGPLSRAEKKARKLMNAQEEYINCVNWMLEVMADTPVPQRRTVHRDLIAEVRGNLKGNPLYKSASFDRTVNYEIEETVTGGVYLPIGFGVDSHITNQQRQIARLAKEQFGKRWRYGMVNIYSLGA